MTKQNVYAQSFNTGVNDQTALARTDLERMRLAAEIQTNLIPKAVGPGFMRPGLQYLTTTAASAQARLKEFVFGVADAAMFEFTANTLRVMLNDAVISRQAVSCTVTNGDFGAATGWDTTGFGGGSATIIGGQLVLNANNINGIAKCTQGVTTASPGQEHALRVVVARGPVYFRVGSSVGADDYVEDSSLDTGEHSLAFTPTGTFYIQFSSTLRMLKIVEGVQIEGPGEMTLPTSWALSDLPALRIAQSADVCYVACAGQQQKKIERRGSRSWSVSTYQVDDGPFRAQEENRVRLTPGATEGNTTITADSPIFNENYIGALIRLDHAGQLVLQSIAADDSYTDPIRVSGLFHSDVNTRGFHYEVSTGWTGSISLQRSFDSATSGYTNIATFGGTVGNDYSDQDDNSIYWYRLGFKPGTYGSGTAQCQLRRDGGGGYGIARVLSVISSTIVNVEVLTPFKNVIFTKDWRISRWSSQYGWPSAVVLSDGRLWWAGADILDGSVSDAYKSFNEETVGDSGPISRAIATGGVNNTQWLLSLQRLLAGTEGAIATVKSSSLDEPLTPTNFGIRDSSTTGVAAVDPIKVDARGIFVERAGSALIELTFDAGASDYVATQISKLTTDIFASGVRAASVQRRPDTRIWIVLEDGSCVCMLYEPDDKVLAFVPVETDGLIESVAVLPSVVQDRVYFSILRQINGSPVRYIEKMALDSEVKPSVLCKVMDAFASGINSPASATVHIGNHLIGETVVMWADGAPIEASLGTPATFVVDNSGNVTLPAPVTNWVGGLPYQARYKSARLAYGAQGGTAMLQKKTVDGLGLILTDFVRSGIKYGHSFTDPYRPLFHMPQMAEGKIQPNVVLSDIRDEETFTFPGEWNTDSRVCIEVASPYTGTFLGMVFGITTNG